MSLPAPLPENEPARLARLHSLAILDTLPEAIFDALARGAAEACGTPGAMVTLIDADRQWFKAAIGPLSLHETSRETAFCAHTLLADGLLEVPDLTRDARFADNPLVTGAANVRFYAGVALVLDDGLCVGTLCVIDHVPRRLDARQIATLRHLATATAEALVFRARAADAYKEADQARNRVADLYRATPRPMFSMDPEARVLTVNDSWLAETGYARDEVEGRCIFDFLTPPSRAFAKDVGMPNFIRTGHTDGTEYQVICKDGQLIDVLVASHLERDEHGAPLRSMSIFENITLRRRAEQALRDEQARMARILEGTNAGTWELNVQTDETRYNERWASMAGYTLAELGQTTAGTWRDLIHPDDLPRAIALCCDHYEGKSDYYDCEFRIRHKQGEWIWVRDRGSVSTRDGEGQPLWMHGTRAEITVRKRAEAALRESQSFLSRVSQVAGVGGWELDFRTGIVVWSEETCRLHEEPAGHHPDLTQALGYFCAEARELIQRTVHEGMTLGRSFDLELPMVSAKGRAMWVRTAGSVEFEDGKAVRLVGALQDISRRKQMEAELARSREMLQVTLDSIGDAVITTDTDGVVQWLNPVAERMTGWSKADAVGRPLAQVFVVIGEETRLPARDPVAVCLAKAEIVGVSVDITLVSRSGTEYAIEDSAAPIRHGDGGAVHGAVLVFHDVSEQRRLNREMSHRATHDLLTGLLNRGAFEERLARLLERFDDDTAASTLLYIDLDQFKLVNDACGHGAGDHLLRQVSAILRTCVRGHDSLARLGGDEFGVVLEHCDDASGLRIAQMICDQMDEFRFMHDGRRFRIGASIGLVPVDARWSNIKALMQAADAACYAAKHGGRNRVHAWFDSDQLLKTRHGEMQWVNRLEVALDEDRFELFGQRIEAIDADRATNGQHFEVLLRLREPNGTLVPPGAFLPAAERFHLATRLDRYVVRKALAWMRVAEERGADVEMMAINLSGQSLGDRAFHRDMMQLLQRATFDLRKLCFEITETAAITHLDEARTFIEEVRSLGVRIALDDFGAGASSFGYLKSLPVDFLKIDGHFITTLLEDELNHAAVRCFCDVAKVVGVRTIAEFVERADVREALGLLGVDMAQGYLVHRPEPLSNLLACVPA